MARKKSLDQGPILRSQILAAASHLFYERGFAAASIREIAQAVGISSSTMYHHFPNKQAVLSAVVTNFMTDFNAATIPLLNDRSLDVVDRLCSVITIHIEMSDDRRPELLAGNPVRYALDPHQRKRVLEQEAEYNTAIRELIKEGQDQGTFTVPDAGLATMALLDSLNGIREWFNPAGRVDRASVIDIYFTFALRLLGVDDADDRKMRTTVPTGSDTDTPA